MYYCRRGFCVHSLLRDGRKAVSFQPEIAVVRIAGWITAVPGSSQILVLANAVTRKAIALSSCFGVV